MERQAKEDEKKGRKDADDRAAAQFHYYWLIHEIVTSKPAAEIGK